MTPYLFFLISSRLEIKTGNLKMEIKTTKILFKQLIILFVQFNADLQLVDIFSLVQNGRTVT